MNQCVGTYRYRYLPSRVEFEAAQVYRQNWVSRSFGASVPPGRMGKVDNAFVGK